MAFFEFLEGILKFLQGLVEINEVFSWGGSKKDKRNALQSNGPQQQTLGGSFLRSLGCLAVLGVVVLGVLFVIGTFVAPPPKSTPTAPMPSTRPSTRPSIRPSIRPSPTTPTSPNDIKIPKLSQ